MITPFRKIVVFHGPGLRIHRASAGRSSMTAPIDHTPPSRKQIVGGNIESYAQVCEVAREEAYERMVRHAQERGADAVIGMRYDAAEFAQGVTEVLAYGTAVKLARD